MPIAAQTLANDLVDIRIILHDQNPIPWHGFPSFSSLVDEQLAVLPNSWRTSRAPASHGPRNTAASPPSAAGIPLITYQLWPQTANRSPFVGWKYPWGYEAHRNFPRNRIDPA